MDFFFPYAIFQAKKIDLPRGIDAPNTFPRKDDRKRSTQHIIKKTEYRIPSFSSTSTSHDPHPHYEYETPREEEKLPPVPSPNH